MIILVGSVKSDLFPLVRIASDVKRVANFYSKPVQNETLFVRNFLAVINFNTVTKSKGKLPLLQNSRPTPISLQEIA